MGNKRAKKEEKMDLQELKTTIESENFADLLEEMDSVFLEIDKIAEDLSGGLLSDVNICIDYLSRLTGYYMYLNPILSELRSYKKNKELREYHSLKMQIENEGKKFVSAPVEKEASLAVAEVRRIKNVVEGYVEACKTAISSCQSIIKYFAEERKMGSIE